MNDYAPVNRGLFWFRNDLRLTDMPALTAICNAVSELVLVYINDHGLQATTTYGVNRQGQFRKQFIDESLRDIEQRIEDKGQRIVKIHGEPEAEIVTLVNKYGVTHLGVHTHHGLYERQQIKTLRNQLQNVTFIERDAGTLFDESALPFTLENMPRQFTTFRKKIESVVTPSLPEGEVYSFPPMPKLFKQYDVDSSRSIGQSLFFSGGERAGKARVNEYFFNTHCVASYKETRNALDEHNASTKFSPWLASGCLSVRWIYQQLLEFEAEHVKNASTYWVYFELLWREFFTWSQRNAGSQWFHQGGIRGTAPSCAFSADKLNKWQEGETGYLIVDACMKQLKKTGYMSNRGRQLVASCLVHELNQNWQYGAAWFEHFLIDYDVGSNWGNWLYLAGVGHDPRGHRQFDLHKQTRIYDPEHSFIKRWL